jgi:hypothetical protein
MSDTHTVTYTLSPQLIAGSYDSQHAHELAMAAADLAITGVNHGWVWIENGEVVDSENQPVPGWSPRTGALFQGVKVDAWAEFRCGDPKVEVGP